MIICLSSMHFVFYFIATLFYFFRVLYVHVPWELHCLLHYVFFSIFVLWGCSCLFISAKQSLSSLNLLCICGLLAFDISSRSSLLLILGWPWHVFLFCWLCIWSLSLWFVTVMNHAYMTVRLIGVSKCVYYYIMSAYMTADIYKFTCLQRVVMPSIGICTDF